MPKPILRRRSFLGRALAVAGAAAFAGMAGSCASRGTAGFVGVTTDGAPVQGLYGVRSSGVGTEPVQRAVSAYLASLSPEQRAVSTVPVGDDAWFGWSNLDDTVDREGLSLAVLEPQRRDLALGVLERALSAEGLHTTEAIRRLNTTAGVPHR